MKSPLIRQALVALSIVGSAILLYSCNDAARQEIPLDPTMMTSFSENLSVVDSQNGDRAYYFQTPLLEEYGQAREPYREFRKGIKITTYKKQADSLIVIDATLTANYAIYYTNRRLWEVKGNVTVDRADGKHLYTQQLFWNERTRRVYSNVDTRLVLTDGSYDGVGQGFESDDEFKDWRFRFQKSRMEFDMKPFEQRDSTVNNPNR